MSDLDLTGIPAGLREEASRLVRPAARIVPTGALPSYPTASYVRGYPFVPEGSDPTWPVDASGAPMVFLVQVNFAEVPALPGFPPEGMLQWFCGSDDTFGLTFDGERQGLDGLHARWWSPEDLARPALHAPTDPVPVVPDHQEFFSPAQDPDPVGVSFVPAPSLPGWEDSTAGMSEAYQAALAEDEVPGPFDSGIGGYPDFVQSDPRIVHPDRASQLLVELGECGGLFEWADSGTAQLFGDPSALARGDLSSLWWDWACG